MANLQNAFTTGCIHIMKLLKELFFGPAIAADGIERKLGCGALLLSTYLDRERSLVSDEYLQQLPPTEKKAILLFQRGHGAPTFPGALGGPGGLFEVEADPTPAVAAKREAMEEANITFVPEEPCLTKARLADRDVIYFIGRWYINEGGIRYNDGEVIGHVWLTGEEALRANLSFAYKNAVRKLIKQRRL